MAIIILHIRYPLNMKPFKQLTKEGLVGNSETPKDIL